MKNKTTIKPKVQPGIRPGINKEDIIKSLNDNDWKRIKLMKDVDNLFVNNEDATQCAVRTDQLYQEYHRTRTAVTGMVFNMLSVRSRLTQLKIDIAKGETLETYPGSQNKMSTRDLKIMTWDMEAKIAETKRQLWLLLTDLYRYVDTQRLDKFIFFKKEQYQQLLDKIKLELKEHSIELYED